MLHLVGSSVLLHLIDDSRSNKIKNKNHSPNEPFFFIYLNDYWLIKVHISVYEAWNMILTSTKFANLISPFNNYLGKAIQMNQLDATMIYWSIRSAQHVSGNILPIMRSVRRRYLQLTASCCCGGQGDGERQRGTMCKYLSLTILMLGKILPEICWADLIDQ